MRQALFDSLFATQAHRRHEVGAHRVGFGDLLVLFIALSRQSINLEVLAAYCQTIR